MCNSNKFYPFFTTVRPNLLVCKYLGMCSISNIFSSGSSKDLEWKALSFGNLYVIFFSIFCQYNAPGGIEVLTEYNEFRRLKTYLHLFQSVLNTISDKKLLEVLSNAEDADELMKPYLTEDKLNLTSRKYKWLMLIFPYDIYIFYRYLHERETKESVFSFENIIVLVYYHGSFLSMVSLFCTIISELAERFQVLRLIIKRNSEMCNDPRFLEDCRNIHTKLSVSSEKFCECFSARITNQLLIISLHTVTMYCSSCFYGEGCEAFGFIQKMLQQLAVVCMICYCAQKLDDQNKNILDELYVIPLDKQPYKCKTQIKLFSTQVVVSSLKITAFGFFDVEMSTVLSMFSVILMYTVIVAQLADRLESYFTN